MKQFKLNLLPLFAAVAIVLSSCSGGGSTEEKNADTTSSTATDTQKVAASTIVTTPQAMMLVTHKVSNFQKWLAAFEANDSFKLANGIHNYVVGRGFEDSNTVFVATRADNMEKAKAFAKSADLKKAMQKSGVVGAPVISFITLTWQDTARLDNTTLRSRTNFSVKDWTAWVKGFTEGKSEREGNGIIDRAYGHDPNDDTKVELVTALTDTAKAFAYYKSDELKNRRAASGVIGEPKRFLFYVVKRY